MKTQVIGLKEFRAKLPGIRKKIVKEGWTYIVTERNIPVLYIQSAANNSATTGQNLPRVNTPQPKQSLADVLSSMQWSDPSGDNHLSQHIDEIVYGL